MSEPTLADVIAMMTNLAASIAHLNTKMDAQAADIADVKSQVSEVNNRVTNLENRSRPSSRPPTPLKNVADKDDIVETPHRDSHSPIPTFTAMAGPLKMESADNTPELPERRETARGKDDAGNDKDENTSKANNSNRRQSMLGREIAQSQSLVHGNQVVFNAQEPSKSHLKISGALTAAKVGVFFENAKTYILMHKLPLVICAHIDEAILDLLAAKYLPSKRKDELFLLEAEKVLNMMQREIQPQNKREFSTVLENEVQFDYPSDKLPSSTQFERFYNALLAYKISFFRVYELLKEFNDSDNVPDCNFRPGGLLKIFIDKIPYQYGSNVNQLISPDKYSNLESYLDIFIEIAQRHSQEAKNARSLQGLFGGTSYDAAKALIHSTRATTAVSTATAAPAPAYTVATHNALSLSPRSTVCYTYVFHDECDNPDCEFSHDKMAVRRERLRKYDMLGKLMGLPDPPAAPPPEAAVNRHHTATAGSQR